MNIINPRPKLLIVPYGIETPHAFTNVVASELLIVPYGIETYSAEEEAGAGDAFNRTLWN